MNFGRILDEFWPNLEVKNHALFCGCKWGEIRVVQDIALWVQSPRKIRPNGAPNSHYLLVEFLPFYSSLSDASSKITGNGYFSPFLLSCEDWFRPLALRSNNAIKIAVTGESATVISFISDDADISEAFDSVIEVLSRTYPSESVRRILTDKSSSAGEK